MWLIFTQNLLETVFKYVDLYNRNSRHKHIIPKSLKKLKNKKKQNVEVYSQNLKCLFYWTTINADHSKKF